MSKPNLIYKTRGEKQSPRGKPKVFFTCAKEDFDEYFEKESEDILWSDDNIDCAVWYNKDIDYDFDNDEEKEEYYSLLHDMNLFVIPVTLEFLKGNHRAYKTDFIYARDNHIPLLMIMEEKGLESLFETMCGKIQYLDRFQDITTQESFDDKLKKFLGDTLISNELAQKIRDSFDAYVFLSYRKKDRKEALEVMKELHSNDFMRDIAIWFDENLIPGENFSDAIKDALEKSELFTMIVTPNLNENPNYVMEKEYPSARDNNKQILPIMAKDTDEKELSHNFKSLPEVVSINDKKTISDKLISLLHKEAYKENDDPEHLYYIGLAYLNRIDVEKNTEKGIELLNKSADKEYIPALEKLVSIYETGRGTKINYEKAIEYQRKLIILKESNNINLNILLTDYNNLASLMKKNGNYKEALKLHEIVYTKRKEILGEGHLDTLSSLHNLAVSYGDNGKYAKSQEVLEKICRKQKEILGVNHRDTLMSLNDLAFSYGETGNVLKALETIKTVNEKLNEILGENHLYTLTSLHNLAYFYAKTNDYANALKLFEKCYYKLKEIHGENHPNTLLTLNNIAHLYGKTGNVDKSLEVNKRVYEKYKETLGENHPDTLISLNNLAYSYGQTGNTTEELKLYDEIYKKSKETLGENHPDTLSVLSNIAYFYENFREYDKASVLLEKLYKKQKETLGENNPKTLKTLDDLAYIFKEANNYYKASELYELLYEKYKKTLGENHQRTIITLNNLVNTYGRIGNYFKVLEFGEKLFLKQEEILSENNTDALESLKSVADAYYGLNNLHESEKIYNKIYDKYVTLYGKDSEKTKEVLSRLKICEQKNNNFFTMLFSNLRHKK